MTSYLTDLPNPSTFGESFNYAVWTPNTQIELCNVPWTSDYRDIVDFDTQAELDAYLDSVSGPKVQISKMTLARAGDPVRINLPFNAAYSYNYLRVNNGTNPITAKYIDPNGVIQTVTDTPKTLYYFIQDVSYIAPNTTQLSVMLDVWQTFSRDINFGNCYIERGHIGVANTNAFYNQGRDYLCVPEALDIGNEYLVNATYRFQIPDNQEAPAPGDGTEADSLKEFAAWIVIGIAADVTIDPGDTKNPTLHTTPVTSNADGMPNGFAVLYFKSIGDFQWFVKNFAKQPWITQSIMFITMIPPLDSTVAMGAFPVFDTSTNAQDLTRAYSLQNTFTPGISRTIASSFRDHAADFIPERYQYLKKFLTSPYMWVELTTYNGAPLMLRPELIPDDDLIVDIYQHSAPPSPRWAIVPKHYNATGSGGDSDDGEFLDIATYITNFPQFTILNNNYLSYLASNKNSIAYGYSSADWSQQKAFHGNDTAFDNAGAGAANTLNQASIQRAANDAANFNNNVNAGAQGLMGAINDLGHLNPVGAASDVLGTGVGIIASSANNNVRNNQITQSSNTQAEYAQGVARRNYDFANFAAKGDYQNSINAVQARVQDAKMIQPSSVGQLGGESFIASIMGAPLPNPSGHQFSGKEFAGWRIYAKIKQIDHNYMALVGEYWLRYGYAINRFGRLPSSLKCMSKFTYWKLKETYITSSLCPEVYKQTIRGIFEKGVTVWSDPNDIGNIDLATNTPLAGIFL